MPAKLKCQSSDIVTVNQFEVATREYLKYNKKNRGSKHKDNQKLQILYFHT